MQPTAAYEVLCVINEISCFITDSISHELMCCVLARVVIGVLHGADPGAALRALLHILRLNMLVELCVRLSGFVRMVGANPGAILISYSTTPAGCRVV